MFFLDQSKTLITTTYLITKEDYVNLSISKLKIDRKNPDTIKQKVASFIMVIFLSLWFFRPGESLSIVSCLLIVFLGFLFLFLLDMYMVKKLAVDIYEKEKKNLLSQTFTLYEDSLSIKTDRYSARIPFDMLYEVYEDQEVFVICTSIADMKFIPKRVLDVAQRNLFREIIEKNLSRSFLKI